MYKKAYSLLTITMMVLIGFFTFIPTTSRAPLGNPLSIGWTQSPETAYYNESVYFNGWVTGGEETYDFRWVTDGETEWENGTDGESLFTYTYSPTESPQSYGISMYVNDSSPPPGPYAKGKSSFTTIYILYDIYIGEVDTRLLYRYPEDPITVKFRITNKCSAEIHKCPGFDVHFEIYTYHLIWDTRDETNFEATYEYRQDLGECASTPELSVDIQNPGEPPEGYGYKVRAEITYAPYDNDDTWKHVDWSDGFTVE
jgi:hypothetical protein